MPYIKSVITFIETKLFTRLVQGYLSDEEYQELQAALSESPKEGAVIPNTGGVRKLRWRGKGQGKRGGYRVIYFLKPEQQVIWLLTMYPKNVADSISPKILRKIRQEIENE